jgi:hypothetical protein
MEVKQREEAGGSSLMELDAQGEDRYISAEDQEWPLNI